MKKFNYSEVRKVLDEMEACVERVKTLCAEFKKACDEYEGFVQHPPYSNPSEENWGV